ncbi:S1 family peptidase [Nannocystis radixulma]|uniref:Serine protease n=1 Tax=Nannocystis radixulma TaxID=2995305 RepID=A0ABT5BD13_9BACT|nr:serine protease [Nannocystis radixulma]MDC0672028.1 serine protease [Nannocystis radixulma]
MTSQDSMESHEVEAEAVPVIRPPERRRTPAMGGLEVIHRMFPCPLVVRGGTFELPPESEWHAVLTAARPRLEAMVGAVGRLECPELGPAMQLGTAWLVRDDVAVTNRHSLLPFLDDMERGTRSFRIDLCAEVGSEADLRCPVLRVLYLAPDLDLAFVQVAQLRSPRAAIPIVDTIVPEHPVAVIGFPHDESAEYGSEAYQQCFKDGFDREGRGFKRISLGHLTGMTRTAVEHDCTTLGGSSGSVIVDLVRGAAIGLNFGQSFETMLNSGVPGWLVRDRLARL